MHTSSQQNEENQTRKCCVNLLLAVVLWKLFTLGNNTEALKALGCLMFVHWTALAFFRESQVFQLYHHKLFTEVSLLRSQQPARGVG